MTDPRAIRRVDLIALLGTGDSGYDDQPAVDLLEGLSTDELSLKAIPTRELREIYERRRARMPDTHPHVVSVDRLLTALADHGGAHVYAISLVAPDVTGSIWLSDSRDIMLSALVRENRRCHETAPT